MEGGISLTVGSVSSRPTIPQFTLTCVTSGGPATSVAWVVGSTLSNGVKRTVLEDPVTARYTHTLTVSGSLTRGYRCVVTNANEDSRADATFAPGIIDSTFCLIQLTK